MIFMVDALRQRLSGNPFLLALKQKRLEGKRACRTKYSHYIFSIAIKINNVQFMQSRTKK